MPEDCKTNNLVKVRICENQEDDCKCRDINLILYSKNKRKEVSYEKTKYRDMIHEDLVYLTAKLNEHDVRTSLTEQQVKDILREGNSSAVDAILFPLKNEGFSKYEEARFQQLKENCDRRKLKIICQYNRIEVPKVKVPEMVKDIVTREVINPCTYFNIYLEVINYLNNIYDVKIKYEDLDDLIGDQLREDFIFKDTLKEMCQYDVDCELVKKLASPTVQSVPALVGFLLDCTDGLDWLIHQNIEEVY